MLNISLEHVHEENKVLNFRVYVDHGDSVTSLGGWRVIQGYINPPAYHNHATGTWVNMFHATKNLQEIIYQLVTEEMGKRPKLPQLRELEAACHKWLLDKESLAKIAPKVYKALGGEER